MFEEPIRFFMDVVGGSIGPRFLYADDTFVNPVLARHYDCPASIPSNEWCGLITQTPLCVFDTMSFVPMSFFSDDHHRFYGPPAGQARIIGHPPFARQQVPPPPQNFRVAEATRQAGRPQSALTFLASTAGQKLRRCHAHSTLSVGLRGYGPVGEHVSSILRSSVDTTRHFRGQRRGRTRRCGLPARRSSSRSSSTINAARCLVILGRSFVAFGRRPHDDMRAKTRNQWLCFKQPGGDNYHSRIPNPGRGHPSQSDESQSEFTSKPGLLSQPEGFLPSEGVDSARDRLRFSSPQGRGPGEGDAAPSVRCKLKPKDRAKYFGKVSPTKFLRGVGVPCPSVARIGRFGAPRARTAPRPFQTLRRLFMQWHNSQHVGGGRRRDELGSASSHASLKARGIHHRLFQ